MRKIQLLCIGDKAPAWVEEAVSFYLKRLAKYCKLTLKTLPTPKRGSNTDVNALKEHEKSLLNKHLKGHSVIALDEQGTLFTSERFSKQLKTWHDLPTPVSFVIGGPDGFHLSFLKEAHAVWSLSPLTFPHALARVLCLEQLYRGYSLLGGSPYHRGS